MRAVRLRVAWHFALCAGLALTSVVPTAFHASALSRTHQVFFPDDTSDYEPRGMAIIEDAAKAGRTDGTLCAKVIGHTDRTGALERRQVISRLRAEAVARELVRHGMKAECVFVVACGDRRLLVPTREGVPEPLNRHVEIVPMPEGWFEQTLGPNSCPWERMREAAP